MKNKITIIAESGLLTAIAVVLLFSGSVFPNMAISVSALAGMTVAAAVIRRGIVPSLITFTASAVVSLIIVPEKTAVILFIVFFGYYPCVKAYAEGFKRRIIGLVIKLTAFNIAFFMVIFFFSYIIYNRWPEISIYIILPLFNAVFVLYDIAFTRLIAAFRSRLKVGT